MSISYKTFLVPFRWTGSVVVYLSVPQSNWVTSASVAVSWYGRRIVLTFAPGLVTGLCIWSTMHSIGPMGGGTMLPTILAPVLVPTLVPFVATLIGIGIAYVTIVIGNLFYLTIHCFSRKQKVETNVEPVR